MKKKLKTRAKELGFHQISVIPVQPLPIWDKAIKARKALDPNTADYWKSRGLVSECRFVMENAETIISAIYPYQPYKKNFSRGQGCYSAHYEAYPKGRNAMVELGCLLTGQGYDIIVDPPVPAKQIAYLSGLGRFGKNGLIYHPGLGSFLTLHILLTNAKLAPDNIELGEISDCGTCRLCMDACPMQAIAEDGVVLISRCMRHYMLSSEIIPVEVREKLGNRMLGCEDCQIICPKNRAGTGQRIELEANPNLFDIRKLLSDYNSGLKRYMIPIGERLGKNYARSQRILSMAVIVAGNSDDDSYLPLLAKTLYHSHPTVRAHSAWAIGKLGDQHVRELLVAAKIQEEHPDVQQEISLALQKVTTRDEADFLFYAKHLPAGKRMI